MQKRHPKPPRSLEQANYGSWKSVSNASFHSFAGLVIRCRSLIAAGSVSTTERPEFRSGLSATFYTENFSKSSPDAAPQICACQPHTV